MSLFGKILAIFNIFAVLGTVALMAMSYAKRQNWQYQVYRQDLVKNGLPIGDEKDESGKNKIGEGTQKDLFKQASPSTPVASQKDEVNRVKRELETQYKSAADKKQQIAALARILAPMADTSEQLLGMIAYQTHLRDDKTFAALQQRLKNADEAANKRVKEAPPKTYEEAFHDALAAVFSAPLGPLAEAFLVAKKADANATVEQALDKSLDAQLTRLQGQFEQMFSNALNGGEGAKPGATEQQKRAIARLLFNTIEVAPAPAGQDAAAPPDLNGPVYKRFFIVVGVKAALEAVNEQASILQNLTFELEKERMRQRGQFAVAHRKAVDLVREKKTDVDHHKDLKKSKVAERKTHEDTLKARVKDVAFYENQLTTARQQTAANLKKLRVLSNQLFDDRAKLRDNSAANQQLEKDIRALEEGR